MKLLPRIALVLLLPLAVAAPARANEVVAANAITRYYQHYLGRTPGTMEIESWFYHMRQTGASLEQVEAGIIASREYFRNCGFNPRNWASTMFIDVVGRNPTVREYQLIVNQLSFNLGDRSRTAEEFLYAVRGPR